MRLQRLEVAGFGCLSDVSMDFHPTLTVLLGDNESGKSTVQRAVRAALYGVDAGGQGRPVERSEWTRWQPWTGARYAVALTYVLDAGRVVRVSRRLDTREQAVQVLEIGGSDLTDEVRRGRTVVPGLFHLGIDETVFCATAWLGDEGLRLAAPDGASQRAEQLQEAIERLADSRRGVTAAQALTRLREVLYEVGTERRSTSPLGSVSVRLRELDRELGDAQRRLESVALERERLRRLEAAAASAAMRRDAAEREWLSAKLAAIHRRQQLLRAAARERDEEERTLAATATFAGFPLELETQVSAASGELSQAVLNANEADARLAANAAGLAAARKRRAEVDAGLQVVGEASAPDESIAGAAEGAARELDRLSHAAAQVRADASSDVRVRALRQEIARTGLGVMPLGSATALAELVSAASGRRHAGRWAGAALACLAVTGVAAGLLVAHRAGSAAAASLGLGAACLATLATVALLRYRRAGAASAGIAQLETRLGIEAGELRTVSDRMPALQALHAALRQEEAAAAGRRAEADAVAAAAATLVDRCEQLARTAGIAMAGDAPATVDAALTRAGALLDEVNRALALLRRRQELEAERVRLDTQINAGEAILDEQQRCHETVRRLRERIASMLTGAGLQGDGTIGGAVAAVRDACEARIRHDAARRALAAISQRIAVLGDEGSLRRAFEQFTAELVDRGGAFDPATSADADDALLQQLEREARTAAQAEASAGSQARELRARLDGVLEGLPELADLQDARDACAESRQRHLRQQAAILRAIELVETSARATHRDLAPRLAERVAAHLDALTGARYRAVNVDTDHFSVSLLGRDRPDMVPLELVSHGTRDQVSLLLRMAMCEVLSGSGEHVPLLLDEPLLTADPVRRTALLEFLHTMSATHQVVISTADPAVADATRRAWGDDCAIVPVGGQARTAGRVRVAS